jgi:hypothetical protein
MPDFEDFAFSSSIRAEGKAVRFSDFYTLGKRCFKKGF